MMCHLYLWIGLLSISDWEYEVWFAICLVIIGIKRQYKIVDRKKGVVFIVCYLRTDGSFVWKIQVRE